MAEKGFKHRLAGIVSADVKGYSRLMREDEDATITTSTIYRSSIIDIVYQYWDRLFDSPDDNFLAEFASVKLASFKWVFPL